eukprot:TRINITY_DN48320_c0_g1_i1.p1 TRINITY_DN48320_c0_g1~~TRINITY_DN48320_c0_g1_i1.p1  ORF type:complete len:883 (+),score=226.75 TRINITY_DN48320_c0_g1_i1:190-2838(+)
MGCCASAQEDAMSDEDERMNDVEEMLRKRNAAEDAAGSTVELTIRCRNLGGRHNTFIVVYEVDQNVPKQVGRTEAVPNATDPAFTQRISLLYRFETVQQLVFELKDEVQPLEHVSLGHLAISLPALIDRSPVTESLWKRAGGDAAAGTKAGTIVISAQDVKNNAERPEYECLLTFACNDLFAMNWAGAGGSDPFLVISRTEQGSFVPVYKSEYRTGVQACEWKQVAIRLDRLCGRDSDHSYDFNTWILLEVFDWERSGKHRLIGCCRTTLAQMLNGVPSQPHEEETAIGMQRRKVKCEWELVNRSRIGTTTGGIISGKTPYVSSGILQLVRIHIDTSHSFLEYVRGGFEINLSICVDFSESNGRFEDVRSLHYRDPSGRRIDNEYTQALRSVVQVLGEYDKDQEFPFWGFGGRPAGAPPDQVQHIFPVSGDMDNVEVSGVDGVLEAYWDCLSRISPSEPTCFSKCLDKIYRLCAHRKDGYQIVLFVTDGQVDKEDLKTTVDLIVACADHALSIIIVGVGRGPFEAMEYLDGEETPLVSSDGKVPGRDLVGFVQYSEYSRDPEGLARATLREIPKQFTKWAKLHGVKPPERGDDDVKSPLRPRESPDAFANAASPGKAPEGSVTVTKRAGQGMGLQLDGLAVAGVEPGLPADRAGVGQYVGWRLSHINDTPLNSLDDVVRVSRPLARAVLRFVDDLPDWEEEEEYEEEQYDDEALSAEPELTSVLRRNVTLGTMTHSRSGPSEQKRRRRRKHRRRHDEELQELLELTVPAVTSPASDGTRRRRRHRHSNPDSSSRRRRRHGQTSGDSNPSPTAPYTALGERGAMRSPLSARSLTGLFSEVRHVESERGSLPGTFRVRPEVRGRGATFNDRLAQHRPPPIAAPI